jgi:hypothetical protein
LGGTIAGLGAELSADGISPNLPSFFSFFFLFACLLEKLRDIHGFARVAIARAGKPLSDHD